MKYYMKYMSKPPLFSSEFRQQKPQTAASYRELIEIQKKKTTERDDRQVLNLLNSQRKVLIIICSQTFKIMQFNNLF